MKYTIVITHFSFSSRAIRFVFANKRPDACGTASNSRRKRNRTTFLIFYKIINMFAMNSSIYTVGSGELPLNVQHHLGMAGVTKKKIVIVHFNINYKNWQNTISRSNFYLGVRRRYRRPLRQVVNVRHWLWHVNACGHRMHFHIFHIPFFALLLWIFIEKFAYAITYGVRMLAATPDRKKIIIDHMFAHRHVTHLHDHISVWMLMEKKQCSKYNKSIYKVFMT